MPEHVLRVIDLETSFTRDNKEIKILRGVNFSIRKGDSRLSGRIGQWKKLNIVIHHAIISRYYRQNRQWLYTF